MIYLDKYKRQNGPHRPLDSNISFHITEISSIVLNSTEAQTATEELFLKAIFGSMTDRDRWAKVHPYVTVGINSLITADSKQSTNEADLTNVIKPVNKSS